jgi:CheY-like chemotaxis protein
MTDDFIILMADDDEDDRMLTKTAWAKSKVKNRLLFVNDGVELLDYLHKRGAWAAPGAAPTPGLILLDLNMPRMDGREALQQIRADESTRHIPIVVLTTSEAEEDVLRTYHLGVNSFITKPVTFDGLVKAVQTMSEYWLQIVRVPAHQTQS